MNQETIGSSHQTIQDKPGDIVHPQERSKLEAQQLLLRWEEEEARDAALDEAARAALERAASEATRRVTAAAEKAYEQEHLNMDEPPPDGGATGAMKAAGALYDG